MASYPSARYRGVSTRDAFIPLLLLALITILVGCGASASQPSGQTPSPTKKELKGTISEFPLPSRLLAPYSITTGPDGNLWFTERGFPSHIGRITPMGTVSEFPLPAPNRYPGSITAGPDGNLWFTENDPVTQIGKIGRITPTGTISEFVIPTASSDPLGITAGPDGTLWFVESFGNKIGRIT